MTASKRFHSCKGCFTLFVKREKLMLAVFSSVLVGFIVGMSINKSVQSMKEPDKTTLLVVIGFPGELLVRMLRMLVLPLIVCSLISGLAGLEKNATGRIGRRAVVYYLSTTFIAAVLGLIIVVTIQPGAKASIGGDLPSQPKTNTLDSFLDLLRNMFPDNIVQACFEQAKTSQKMLKIPVKNVTVDYTKTNASQMEILKKKYTFVTEIINKTTGANRTFYTVYESVAVSGPISYMSGQNLIGVVVFSMAVGFVSARLGEESKPFLSFVDALNKIVGKLIYYVMWYSIMGIWSLIAVAFAKMKDIGSTFESLAMLVVCVMLGFVIHALLVYPGIYFLILRKNPYKYFRGIAQPLITAFGTSSSAATLPVTMSCLQERQNIDPRIVKFMVPIGATVNMDGSAFYQGLACIFLAQAYNYDLNFGKYIGICLAAVMASIGAAGVPSVAPVSILIVLQAAGLPTESIYLIFTIDWFIDRFKTAVNVCGDCFGAAVVEYLSRHDLATPENCHELTKSRTDSDSKKKDQSLLNLVNQNDNVTML